MIGFCRRAIPSGMALCAGQKKAGGRGVPEASSASAQRAPLEAARQTPRTTKNSKFRHYDSNRDRQKLESHTLVNGFFLSAPF